MMAGTLTAILFLEEEVQCKEWQRNKIEGAWVLDLILNCLPADFYYIFMLFKALLFRIFKN